MQKNERQNSALFFYFLTNFLPYNYAIICLWLNKHEEDVERLEVEQKTPLQPINYQGDFGAK